MSKAAIESLVDGGMLTQMKLVGRRSKRAARRVLVTRNYLQFADALRKEAKTSIAAARLEQLLGGIAVGNHVNNRTIFRRLTHDIFAIREIHPPQYRVFCLFPYPDCIVLLSGMSRAKIPPGAGWDELTAASRRLWDELAPGVPPFRAERFDAYITVGAQHYDW